MRKLIVLLILAVPLWAQLSPGSGGGTIAKVLNVIKGDGAGNGVDSGIAASSIVSLHAITFTIDGGGSAITTGAVNLFIPIHFSCTVQRYDIAADQSGSITIDVWAANGAIPTSGNKISASAPMTLSSAQLSQNGSRTGWNGMLSDGFVMGFSVATASTVTRVYGVIWCQ